MDLFVSCWVNESSWYHSLILKCPKSSELHWRISVLSAYQFSQVLLLLKSWIPCGYAVLEVAVCDSSGSKAAVTTPNAGAAWCWISCCWATPGTGWVFFPFLLPTDHVSAPLNFLALGKGQALPLSSSWWSTECCWCQCGWAASPAPRRALTSPGAGTMLLRVNFNFLCQKRPFLPGHLNPSLDLALSWVVHVIK